MEFAWLGYSIMIDILPKSERRENLVSYGYLAIIVAAIRPLIKVSTITQFSPFSIT
jgi:hypothetical protein